MNTSTRTKATAATFAGYRLVGYTEHPRMTRETISFDADVHYRGNLVGTLSNDGQGGEHRFTATGSDTYQAINTANKVFPGIRNTKYGFTNDLFESLALTGDIAKTLWGTRYISLVPDMSIGAVLGGGDELSVFRAPRSAGAAHALAQGLLEEQPEVGSVVYPMREGGGVWLYETTR